MVRNVLILLRSFGKAMGLVPVTPTALERVPCRLRVPLALSEGRLGGGEAGDGKS